MNPLCGISASASHIAEVNSARGSPLFAAKNSKSHSLHHLHHFVERMLRLCAGPPLNMHAPLERDSLKPCDKGPSKRAQSVSPSIRRRKASP